VGRNLLAGPHRSQRKILEKVYSTTLIYRRCLVFNPQPQNQVLDTHELFKPDKLTPFGGFVSCFGWFSLTWRMWRWLHATWLPHSGATALALQLHSSPVARLTHHLAAHSGGGPGQCCPLHHGPTSPVSSPANHVTSQSVDKMSDTSQAYLQCRVRPPIRSKSRGLIGSRSRSTVCGGVQSLRRSSAMLAGCASHRRWPKLPSSATVAAVVVDAVGEGAGRGNASVMRDFAAPTFGA
jgi:hypothetical protein